MLEVFGLLLWIKQFSYQVEIAAAMLTGGVGGLLVAERLIKLKQNSVVDTP